MNWILVIQIVVTLATFSGVWLASSYVKEIPKFHRDYFNSIRELERDMKKDERGFANNRQLQIESYFRMQGGNKLETLFSEWTDLMMDMDKTKSLGKEGFISLQERTIVYGSDATINLLSAYQSENYSAQKGIDGMKSIVYVAMVICSLKRDFTGFSIEPQTLMKMKINDYNEHSLEVDGYVKEIKQAVNWE